MGYSFYYPPENKVLIARNTEFLENSLITQDANGSLEDPEIIQEEDMHPSINTSLNHEEDDLEIDEPESDIIPIRIDYEETFTPVADIRTIRILIAIAAYYDYEIWQMDVKTAFLNRYLSKEVYMEQPEGFVNPKYPKRVCKLKHSIYGLKQASRQWNKRFDDEIKKFGFTQNPGEPCVDLKASESNNPSDLHWITVKNILKYLRNTKDMFLVYEEAEYIAAFDASKEAVWVRKFISGLDVILIIEKPISMYCDNTGAVTIANESEITKCARHLCAKVHYLREVVEFGAIKLEKVYTYDNLADPFTKSLAFPKHSEHTKVPFG
ncbi:putative retrotransposon protein [Tanacetum coccineum]